MDNVIEIDSVVERALLLEAKRSPGTYEALAFVRAIDQNLQGVAILHFDPGHGDPCLVVQMAATKLVLVGI